MKGSILSRGRDTTSRSLLYPLMGIVDSQTVVGWAEMAEELRDSPTNYRRGWTWYGTAQRRKNFLLLSVGDCDGDCDDDHDHISNM